MKWVQFHCMAFEVNKTYLSVNVLKNAPRSRAFGETELVDFVCISVPLAVLVIGRDIGLIVAAFYVRYISLTQPVSQCTDISTGSQLAL